MKIPIERVIPNSFNPNSLSQDQYELLRRDISEHGLEYPIEVRPLENGTYEIIDGEHRWKACKELGFKQVECEIKDISEAEAKQRNYRLNSARGTIDPLKEALLFQNEIESGMTQQQVAEKYGRSQQFISSRLVLLRLPERVKRKITTRVVTPSHGELLARLPDEEAVENLAQRIIRRKLSVPQTEKWVKWYDKLKVLEEKYPSEKDDVARHRKMIEARPKDYPSFRRLEGLEQVFNLPDVEEEQPVENDKYNWYYWGSLQKNTVEKYRNNLPPKDVLLKFLSGEDSFSEHPVYYEDALIFYDSDLTLQEKMDKAASSPKGNHSHFWAYIHILREWYGVSHSEIEKCLKNKAREKRLRHIMERSWENVNYRLSDVIEENFRSEERFKREVKLLEEYYNNYCFACKELGVQPKPKPPIPAWRDPAYVDVYTLRIRDFFVKKLPHTTWKEWIVKSQRGFPISEVASTLEEDLKFLKARERSAEEEA